MTRRKSPPPKGRFDNPTPFPQAAKDWISILVCIVIMLFVLCGVLTSMLIDSADTDTVQATATNAAIEKANHDKSEYEAEITALTDKHNTDLRDIEELRQQHAFESSALAACDSNYTAAINTKPKTIIRYNQKALDECLFKLDEARSVLHNRIGACNDDHPARRLGE